MKKLVSRTTLYLGTLLILGFGASPTRADVAIMTGNIPQIDENVLLDASQRGMTIFGTTNQTQTQIRFQGTETLISQANGQARIDAADGSFRNLSIAIDTPGSTFASLILNIDATENGFVNFVIEGTGITLTTDTQFAINGAGQNFFTIVASNGQRISNVSFSTTSALVADVSQIRIGGIEANQVAPVPEPATMILLGTGLVGVVGVARRKRRSNSEAK